jgi:hypothetical protein
MVDMNRCHKVVNQIHLTHKIWLARQTEPRSATNESYSESPISQVMPLQASTHDPGQYAVGLLR